MNIVLIGMPGSGKARIGKMAADGSGMAFRDTDEIIRASTGMTFQEIFAVMGRAGFMEVESAACRLVTNSENTVICAGGSAVEREKNMELLRSCGPVVFLDKAPEALLRDADEAEWPPLRKGRELVLDLYSERIALYRKYADRTVAVTDDDSAAETLKEIIAEYREGGRAPEEPDPDALAELSELAKRLDGIDRELVAAFSRRLRAYRELRELRRSRGIAADEEEEDRLACDAALRRVTMDQFDETFAFMRCVLALSKGGEGEK